MKYLAIARDPEHKTPYEFTRWGIVPQPWTLVDYLAIIAAMPIGRAGYELQNLAFLDAMVAQYGPDAGRRIFEDVVPLNDPDSPTTILEGEDLAPRQPMPKPGYFGASVGGFPPRVSSSVDLMERPAEAAIEASRCLVTF
jgi:penicillin amidase